MAVGSVFQMSTDLGRCLANNRPERLGLVGCQGHRGFRVKGLGFRGLGLRVENLVLDPQIPMIGGCIPAIFGLRLRAWMFRRLGKGLEVYCPRFE